MPLLVNSVPNLAQGVSQQPDNLRFPGQCDEQINAWATVVEGLVKRPPTNYKKNIGATDPGVNLFTHFVKRDETNKYCVAVSLGGVGVIDLENGNNIPVTTTSTATSYLSGISNPLADLRALTVADYTFLVNKKKTVAKKSTLSPTPKKEALVVVKLGDYQKAYSIYINNELVPLATTLQGTTAHEVHDYTNTGHLNTRLQPATYISGPSTDGSFADTEYIARDLYDSLEEHYGTTGVTGITSVNISLGGSGWLVEPNFFGAFANNNITKLTFTISQTVGLNINSTAKGTATVENGVITALNFTNRGQGYNTDQATHPLTFNFNSYFYNWKRWNLGAYTTPPTAPTITATIGTLATYDIERQGSVIRIRSRDEDAAEEDFDIKVEDGLANQGLSLVYKEVDSITELPKSCFNNYVVKIIGDADIDQDDYYVRFKTKDGTEFGEGTWIETIGWASDGSEADIQTGIETELDNNTMPITLVPVLDSNGDVTSFKLQTPEEGLTVEAPNEKGWRTRQAGDDETNPFPSFVGNKINDVFFFKNRLGFLTDSNVIFSEADEYFNFFRTTTQQLLDSAVIDVGLSHTKVAVLQHAVPFQEKLMLFSKQSQFVLRGADILSPKTVSISPATEYDISDSVQPIALGNYIYFSFKRNDFEGMYEYFVDNNTETFNSEEITQQIPKYITSNVQKIAGSQAENTIIVNTTEDRKTLFVYKYFWSNKEKIQSAWMKFTFDREVRGFDFIDSNLHLLTKDDDGLHLEQLTLEDGLKDTNLDYTLYLDSRVDGSTLTTSYDAAAKTTTISGFPYDPTDVAIYTKNGHNTTFTRTSSSAGTVVGDLTSTDFFAGKPYNMLYRFSDQTLKQPTERGGRSSSDYAYQTIRNGSINYADTGHFTVEVTPKFRDKYSYAFNPDIVGANLTLNAFTPQNGHFRFPVQAQPEEATIEVKSVSALPVKLLGAEFESMFIPRSRRYGA
jgi:hypothetical protein